MKELKIIKNIYYCKICHYTFPAGKFPERCPDCGKQMLKDKSAIRPATEKEIADYHKIQKEIENEELAHFP